MHDAAVQEYPLPNSKPPLGFDAVPSPMKIRMKSATGLAIAEALGDNTVDAVTPATG